MSRSRLAAVLALLAALVAIVWLRMPQAGSSFKALSDLEVAEAWLHCIDCRGSFLQRLNEMPATSRDTVTKFLTAALLTGPDSVRVRRHRQDILRTWSADSIYRASRGLPTRSGNELQSLLARYQEGFQVLWRGRAATALGVIRSKAALAALDDALNLPVTERADSIIHRFVERARADSARTVLGTALPSRGSTPDIGRVEGRVFNGRDTALANVAISLVGTSLRAMTGPTGEYTLTRVPAGTYSLEARLTGYRPKTARIIVTSGETLIRVDTLIP